MPNAAVRLDREALPRELAEYVAVTERMIATAVTGIHVERDLNPREREFAVRLLRSAKGAQVASAAWAQELKNR